jgi:uncharacterized protein YjgD (DUF1641 family)
MNEDKVLQKLIEHDERLDRIEENMATKADTRSITGTMDEMMVILKRLDQERVFTVEWIRITYQPPEMLGDF